MFRNPLYIATIIPFDYFILYFIVILAIVSDTCNCGVNSTLQIYYYK